MSEVQCPNCKQWFEIKESIDDCSCCSEPIPWDDLD